MKPDLTPEQIQRVGGSVAAGQQKGAGSGSSPIESLPASTPPAGPQPIIWWVLWAAFLIGICFAYRSLGNSGSGIEGYEESEPPNWVIGAGPVFLSAIVRWFFFPRFRNFNRALPYFCMGVGLAELSCYIGIFIFPTHRLELFLLSFIGIAQFAPVYLHKHS